jgi:hypothetical protein
VSSSQLQRYERCQPGKSAQVKGLLSGSAGAHLEEALDATLQAQFVA